MTSVEVDALAKGYESWNRQDIEGGLALLHPEIEWHPPPESPFAGPYKGIAAVRRFAESMLEVFDVRELRDGLAVRYEVYPDTTEMRATLGLDPPPGRRPG